MTNSRIAFVKWLTLSNLRESGVRTFAWKALLPGVYGFVFFTHVLQVHGTNHSRGPRVRCGVLYHVSQMTLYFHGEEQATRELLLPLFEHWTYTSLEAMQQASLEPAYGLLPTSTIPSASPVPGSCPADSPPDTLGLGESTALPAAPPGLVPANQGNNVSAPIADMCNGGLNETTLTSMNLLPHLVEQLIQGQSLLHEALSSLSDRLDNLHPLDGHPPLAVPAQASRCVTSCAPSVHPPALPPRSVAAPEANASASVNEAKASTSVNEDASPEVRVCRRASCRNSVADCCRAGFCSRHCSSQRCPCNVSLAELHARPTVCRRRGCATEVAANCSTGYCPTHCRARWCTCRGVTPDPPAQATRPTVRFCQRPDCGNEVAACNSGFCLAHFRCHACSRVRVPTPPPAPRRNAARRRVCAGAPTVGSLLRLNVELGFAISIVRAHVVTAHMRQAHPRLRPGLFQNGLVVVAAAAKLLLAQVAAPVIVATMASTAHAAAVFHVQIRVSLLLAPCSAICLRFVPTSRLTLPRCQLQSVSLFMRFKLSQAPGARKRPRLSSAPARREPNMLNLAVLDTNRLWMPDGSEHYAFHGLVDFLRSWGVDILCVQESRAPDGACLPTDQPYSYDGPTGIGGCEAGFLVHDCSSSWALSSAAPHSRFRWRYAAACGTESNLF